MASEAAGAYHEDSGAEADNSSHTADSGAGTDNRSDSADGADISGAHTLSKAHICLLYTSFVEGTLTERIGEAGKRLHTGRSRNDQVALDMKLYTRDEIDEMDVLVKELLKELLVIMEANTETFMPGLDVYKRQI